MAVIPAPFGSVIVRAGDTALRGLDVSPDVLEPIAPLGSLLKTAERQLLSYFRDPLSPFDLPIGVHGTSHRMRVWDALRAIPPGQVKTYGQIAGELSSGPRAVAGACRSNEFPILIPCHRVVSSQGLGGYCGRLDGPFLEIKRWLLRHEGYPID